MRRFNRIVSILMVVPIVMAAVWTNVLAQNEPADPKIVITLFWRDGCSHCAEEKPFLQDLADQNSQIALKGYEVYTNTVNREYLYSLGEAMGFETDGVPVTVIGDQVWIGFTEAIGEEIKAAVAACQDTGCPDPGAVHSVDTAGTIISLEVVEVEEEPSSFPLWIIAVIAVVILSYFVGRSRAKPQAKKKAARKRH